MVLYHGVAWQSGAVFHPGAAVAADAAAVSLLAAVLAAAGKGPNKVTRASASSDSSCTMRCAPRLALPLEQRL